VTESLCCAWSWLAVLGVGETVLSTSREVDLSSDEVCSVVSAGVAEKVPCKSTGLPRWGTSNGPLLLGYILLLIVRLYLASQSPINSTDLLRYLGFGKEFWTYGLDIYNHSPADFGDAPYAQLWPHLRFIYPAMAMLFFAGTAAVYPCLFFARLVLTFIELGNALLVSRMSGDKWLGLAFFANPASIWWTSREGQYEALVAFFSLLALLSLRRTSPWSYWWLGLGIQAKYWPGVLLPYFASRERRPKVLGYFVASFVPSVAFALGGSYVFHILTSEAMAMNCNPYFWNFADGSRTCGTPLWHLCLNAIATYGILAVLLAGAVLEWRRRKKPWAYVGPLAFMAYYKSVSWATPWYLPMCFVFALPIERRWVRWAVLVLGSLEPIAWAGLLGHPIGWLNPTPPAAYIFGRVG